MVKRLIILLLTVLMMLSLTSCGVKQSVDEKIAEKVTEGVINKATGGEADLDISDGKLTMKGEDGATATFGDSKWPEGQAADLIPRLKKGNVISVINSDKACIVVLEKVELKDFEKYIEELKSQGFTNDVTEYSIDTNRNYSAKSNDKTTIAVFYDSAGKTITINIDISE